MNNNKNQIISNIGWKFAERVLAQLITLIVSIVLARLLAPDDFGAISMVLVFINIANVFVTEGIPSALIQKKNADQLDFSSVFFFNLFFSLCIYLVVFFSSPFIASFYNSPVLDPVFKVLGLRIVVASINSVQHAYVSRNMMFRKYFWSTLFGTLLSGVVGIAMAYGGMGVWALVAQYMVNTTVDTIVLFITVNWKPSMQFQFQRIKKLFSFGWKMLFEGVSNTINTQIRNLIIGKYYTSADLAYYVKGQQFPSVIVSNISTSIGSVLFPAMANEQEDKNSVLFILRQSVRMTSYIVYPMLVLFAAVATPFVRLVLTDKWLDTVPFLQVFCFTYMPSVAFIPRHQALNGTGRSDVFMYEHLIARIIGVIILVYTYKISIFAIVLGGIVGTIVTTLIIVYTSKHYSGYTYHDQVNDILPILTGCALMGIPVYLLNYVGMSNLLTLFLQVITGSCIYLLYSHIFKLEEYQAIKNYLLMIINNYIKSR